VARLRSGLALALVAAGSMALAYPALAYHVNAERGRRLTAAATAILARPGRAVEVTDLNAGARAVAADRSRGTTGGTRTEVASGLGDGRSREVDRDVTPWAGPVHGRPILEVPAPRDGQALGVLQIPSIALETAIFEGVERSTLMVGPGHLPWTAVPGTGGVSVVAAHRDLHFRSLHQVEIGDRVWLQLPSGTMTYKVVDVSVTVPADPRIASPDPHDPTELRLLTCWPPSIVGPAPDRLVVSAVPARVQSAAPPVAPTPTPAAESSATAGADARDSEARPRVPEPSGGRRAATISEGPTAAPRGAPSGTAPRPAPSLFAPDPGGVADMLPVLGAAGVGLSSLAAFAAWRGPRRRAWFAAFVVGAVALDAALALGRGV
jgi:LPXTG-site transpeptidase (sortase) family protein